MPAPDHRAAPPSGRARPTALALVLVVLVAVLAACRSGGDTTSGPPSGVALQVDGWNLSTEDFLAELDQIAANKGYIDARSAGSPTPFTVFRTGSREPLPAVAAEFLNERVSFRLVEDELRRRNVAVTDADRDQALILLGQTLQRAKDRATSPPATSGPAAATPTTTSPPIPDDQARALGQSVLEGFNGSYRKVLLDGVSGIIALERTLTDSTDTDKTLRALYDRVKDEACVSHILVVAGENAGKQDPATGKPLVPSDAEYQAALVQATDLRAQLAGGADFATLAQTKSGDPASKDKGGDLGCQPKGTYLQAFDDAVWSATPGQVTGPVKTDYGYHLILVRERRSQTFDEARPRLQEALRQQQADALQRWLSDATTKAKVQVDPRFGKWDPSSGSVVVANDSLPLQPLDSSVPPGSTPASGGR